MNRLTAWIPLICGVCIAAGILLGTWIAPQSADVYSGDPYDKIRAVLGYVEKNYVDSVSRKEIIDNTIREMLRRLDPHSGYFTAEEIQEMNEPLQGNFQGIGVEYNVIRDTVVVVNVIKNGPAFKSGVLVGDRIIAAGTKGLTGENSDEKIVKQNLRGPAGTTVSVKVYRKYSDETKSISITRGSIPLYSIEAAYMLNDNTGYIKLVRFAETTVEEFNAAADTLLRQGMKNLVLDLRGNGGGYLDAAVELADHFLPAGKMIVYTKGRADGQQEVHATTEGKLENTGLAILVDENSASASEILAGAIQDNDRGVIIGRRTFGKGLVQEEKPLSDGSAFRLTIARYYTPTGRCIQKPYDHGLEEYEEDELRRYQSGELLSADSVQFPDSLKYTTPGGKVVYGGGGIMPDVFVPLDTTDNSRLLREMFYAHIFTLWAVDYVYRDGAVWKGKAAPAFVEGFKVSDAQVNSVLQMAKAAGIQFTAAEAEKEKEAVRKYIRASVARVLYGDDAYYPVWNENDPVINAALRQFSLKK